ncbi:MAG: ATP-binding cassette domain-containing protein, partial [Sphingomonadales bacterium]|nr:ATP-binding cassette domain-containing protein [Sphingomonadales bacterium]
KLRNRKIGFVFQNFNLLARTSALENVELPLLYSKQTSARQRRGRAVEALERVGLSGRMHHHPGQLSGGEQQRVAIARAMASRPTIIFADEPTGNLDGTTGEKIITLLFDRQKAAAATLLIITHDPELANRCDRIIELRDGLIERDSAA